MFKVHQVQRKSVEDAAAYLPQATLPLISVGKQQLSNSISDRIRDEHQSLHYVQGRSWNLSGVPHASSAHGARRLEAAGGLRDITQQALAPTPF